jgi:transposase
VKLIMWDGTGLCLFGKWLEQGTFRWPKIEDGTMRLMPSQLAALIEGPMLWPFRPSQKETYWA